jgi:tetratricopeptide (TPR) repeat protein
LSLRDLFDPVSWRLEFETSGDPERLRSRVLAAAGVWFLLAGFLAALGLGIVFLASLALLLVGGAVIGTLWLLRHFGVGGRLRGAGGSIEQALRAQRSRLDGVRPQEHVRRSYAAAAGRVRARASRLGQREPATAGLERRAQRLNELGAQLRREGKHEEAAHQHRAALGILRELGDRRAEALTLNNLALALVHTTGGVSQAVQHFEEAAVALHELGDEEHEGQVIANLAFVRRRQGRDEDAESLLYAALDKLPRDSSAYHRVEEQLRRAS